MKQLDIKEYVRTEEDKLKTFAQEHEIKLGIINGTKADEIYIEDFKRIGWKAKNYKGKAFDAIIRAIDQKCTGIIMGADKKPIKYRIPLYLDCGGARVDSEVEPIIPKGIVDYLEACGFVFMGKTAVILASSTEDDISAKIAKLLWRKGMTISICNENSDSSIVSGFLCDADLVICNIGKANSIVRTQCLNAIVVDVNGEDFEEKLEYCSNEVWSINEIEPLQRLALLKNCTLSYYRI